MNAAPASASPDDPQIAAAITRETPQDAAAVDALVMAAFGPGRFAKTAERLRERAPLAAGFCLHEDGRLIGSVRLWAVMTGDARSAFLGPIAVDKASRSTGLGGELVRACIEEARAQGLDGVLLVGEPPYFSRFGFLPAPEAVLPGPVDQRRVMWLPLTEAAPIGAVRPVV
jgi:predicted N-acetyltransferase YhbS